MKRILTPRIGWLLALVAALAGTTWVLRTTPAEIGYESPAAMPHVEIGEWRPVELYSGKRTSPVRVTDIQRHPVLTTEGGETFLPPGGKGMTWVAVFYECRCRSGATTTRDYLIDDRDRLWSEAMESPAGAREVPDLPSDLFLGEPANSKNGLVRVSAFYAVPTDARGLGVIFGKVRLDGETGSVIWGPQRGPRAAAQR